MAIGSAASEYQGPQKRLVVAFDVGTTFSGVSFCILDPNSVPKICNVTKYPGQTALGSAKIPSVMYYDRSGTMTCAGAETALPDVECAAEENNWTRVSWFKLHLRPPSMLSENDTVNLPALPAGKDVVQVFADFLGYLMESTEKFIKETYVTITDALWSALCFDMVLVLPHPNGWEGLQQQQMRESAILAKIITDTPHGHDRIKFVTEGEASLHFCVKGQFVDDTKEGFIIADLGGGTLDFSVYEICRQKPLEVKEKDTPKCIVEGSVLVSHRAHAFLREKLKKSAYGDEKSLEQISRKFDESTKLVFQSENDSYLVAFGSPRDNDKRRDIRCGRLKLSGDEISRFFEPSVHATVKAIEEYAKSCTAGVSAVYLVGGFSSSPYLKSEVERRLQSHNIRVGTPDGQVIKAVTDGSISFYIDHYVTARIARATYGISVNPLLDSNRKDHKKRKSKFYYSFSGRRKLVGAFSTILKKGTLVSEKTEFRKNFFKEHSMDCKDSLFKIQILAYTGPGNPPTWLDEMESSEKRILCTVVADMSRKNIVEIRRTAGPGRGYRRYDFDIVLLFGGPEFKAQISWKEQEDEKRGPAETVYEVF